MRFRLLLCIATLLAAIFGTSAAAFAYSAHTTTTLNVRSGPGASYHKVATLPGGARVNVTGCQGSWCSIHWGGVRGWVSAGYLQRAHIVHPPIVIVRPPHHRPPHWHHRPPHHRPPHHRPPHKPRPGKCKIAPGFACK